MSLETRLLGLPHAGIDAHFNEVDGVLRSWMGFAPPRLPVKGSPTVPAVLTEFHARFASALGWGRWQNHILKADAPGTTGPKLVFAVENQGVYSWATDPQQASESVWGRFEEADPWEPEEPCLSLFLLQFVLLEAILGSPFGASCSWLGRQETERVLSECVALPFGSWRWPQVPSRFFVRRDALAFVCPNGADAYSLTFAALEAGNLAFLRPHLGSAWEHIRIESR